MPDKDDPAPVPVQQDEPEDDPTLDCTDCKMTFGDEGEPYWDFCPPCRKRSMELLREPQTTEDVLAWLNEKRRRFRPVPVQQEPEDECEGCVRLNTQLDEAAKLCAELEADLIAAGGVKNPATGLPVGLAPAVPSVGLRDRVACELANLEYERSGRLCETEDFYADADRVLSVHEAGTQGDWQQARTVRHLLDRIIDGSMANGPTDEDINSAESVTGWIAVASPGPAEAGTQEGENA